MPKVARTRVSYNSARDWPAWTDAEVWEPTDEDRQWAAQHLNADYDADEPVPDHVLDALAGEADAVDLMSRGIRPF